MARPAAMEPSEIRSLHPPPTFWHLSLEVNTAPDWRSVNVHTMDLSTHGRAGLCTPEQGSSRYRYNFGGRKALKQSGRTGDFSTWINRRNTRVQAFAFLHAREDIERMVPATVPR